MDWTPVLAFALGGAFTTLTGLLGAEVHARLEDRRRTRRDAAERIRDRHVAIIQQTQALTLALTGWLAANVRSESPGDFVTVSWPRANLSYIGEPAAHLLLDLYAQVEDPRRDVASTLAAVSKFNTAAMTWLSDQEERALRDEPVIQVPDELSAELNRAAEAPLRRRN